MKIILGLGNPGAEYTVTRHNSGVMLVDKIVSWQLSIDSNNYGWRRKKNIMVAEFPEMILIKSAGYFMNESGFVARDFFKNSPYPLFSKEGEKQNNLYLAHDDLDIKLGEYKIQYGKGPKVHNGVESVENALGTKDFWRIRIGIDNRSIPNAQSGADYVLQRFSKEEKEVLDGVLESICTTLFDSPS